MLHTGICEAEFGRPGSFPSEPDTRELDNSDLHAGYPLQPLLPILHGLLQSLLVQWLWA